MQHTISILTIKEKSMAKEILAGDLISFRFFINASYTYTPSSPLNIKPLCTICEGSTISSPVLFKDLNNQLFVALPSEVPRIPYYHSVRIGDVVSSIRPYHNLIEGL